MADIFTQAKRSEVMSRIRGSEPSEIELVAADAEVLDNVGDDAAWHVAGVPGEGDEAVGLERIGVMPVAAGSAEQFAADFPEAAVQLPAVVRGVFAHGSSREHEFVAKGRRDGTPGFEQGFEMGFGGLLEPEESFAPIASVRVTAGQQAGFGNPYTVFIPAELHLREWNDHDTATVTRPAFRVKSSIHV